MKLVTYRNRLEPRPRLGAVLLDSSLSPRLIDLQRAAQASGQQTPLADMQQLLEAGPEALQQVQSLVASPDSACVVEQTDFELLAPLPRPRSLRDCLSFRQHWIQCARTVASWKFPPLAWIDRGIQRLTGASLLGPPQVWRERPIYYKGNPSSVVGAEAEVQWPSYSQRLDYEAEIAVYIGVQGRDIAVEQAMEHIAGYSLFNDFSARDVQFREMSGRLGPAKSKDFDTGNSLGPWLVTPDELEVREVAIQVRVNGELWSETFAASLQHDVTRTVAFLSRDETLYPGDVIGLGTLPNGCGLELNRWIQPGDVVELSSPTLGTLRNRVTR